MNNANCLTFITNGITEMQNESKRVSLVEYFKNKLGNKEILFLKDTHSTFNDENICKNDFNVPVFYSHGTSQSCGVLILILGILQFMQYMENKKPNKKLYTFR